MILFILFLNYLYFYFSVQALILGFIFFIIFYFIIYIIVKSWNKILPTQNQNFKRELFFTLSNFCIYTLLIHLYFQEFLVWNTQLYFDYWYETLFLWVLFIIAHDIYFYIIHRFLHNTWCLKHIHYIHHQSHISNVCTSYSFHPLEALLYFGVTCIIFIIPMSFFALLIAIFYNDVLTILWHSWKENFSSVTLKKRKLFRFLATPTYHDLHHSRSKWNYALYFLYLDKWFWTYDKNHKDTIL